MKGHWIRMPNGKQVRQKPDKLKLFLQGNRSIITTNIPSTYRELDPAGSSSSRHSVNHDDSDVNFKLRGCEAVIFGIGSVGSYLAYFLAIAGLILHAIDLKKVKNKHIRGGRTIYEPGQTGLYKTNALKQKIERDHLSAVVKTYPYNVREIPIIELKTLLLRSLLVIMAIDDPQEILRISDLAYPIVELIQVAMHTGGNSGHIAIIVPGVTPCLRCTLNIKGPQDINRLDSEPANSLDIITVAQQAARIAIDIMYSKVTGQSITRWDPSKNLIYIANTKQELSPDGPGIHYEDSQRRPGCPICNYRR